MESSTAIVSRLIETVRRIENETWREHGFFVDLADVPEDAPASAIGALSFAFGGHLTHEDIAPEKAVRGAIRACRVIRDNAFAYDKASDTYRPAWKDDKASSRVSDIMVDVGTTPWIREDLSVGLMPTHTCGFFPIRAIDCAREGRAIIRCAHCGLWMAQARPDSKYCRIKCRDRARTQKHRAQKG